MYLRHGLRRPNAAGVWGVGHGTQNSLLAIAHRILTTATPFCALFPPPAALANVPLSTRETWTYGAKSPRRQSRQAASRTAGTSDRSRQPTGDPVLPPQRPLRRRSRFAARWIAGASNRSRQLTRDSRPPSPGKGPGRGTPFRVSGASRKESESFFPATCAAGKILLTERSALPSSQRPLGAETGPLR